MTSDVDLIPRPGRDNLERLAAALRVLEATVLNPGHEDIEVDAAMLPRATIWRLATPHGDLDVLRDAPGAAPYAELRQRAIVIALDDARVPVAGLDDLIRMKLARGRPVDRADVATLTDAEAPERAKPRARLWPHRIQRYRARRGRCCMQSIRRPTLF